MQLLKRLLYTVFAVFGLPAVLHAATFNGYAYTTIDLYVGNTSYGTAGGSTKNIVLGGTYQPRTANGLTSYSAHSDLISSAQAVASLAIYGSDSTRLGLLPPNAGVEPMMDILLSASPRTATGQFTGGGLSIDAEGTAIAQGSVTVSHRVVQSAALPPSINVANLLNNIPLTVLWRYDFSGYGPLYGEFQMSVDSPTGDCANSPIGVPGLCGSYGINTDIATQPANSGSFNFVASATNASRVATYDINLQAYGNVRGSASAGPGASLQGVIDPYLTVDPNWQYASYFTVEQESTVNPGTWTAITRDYLNPVPLPPAFWLFGSGVLGLLVIARRKGRRTASTSIRNGCA